MFYYLGRRLHPLPLCVGRLVHFDQFPIFWRDARLVGAFYTSASEMYRRRQFLNI